jgi:uncharacterized protein involved in propanediol utilization
MEVASTKRDALSVWNDAKQDAASPASLPAAQDPVERGRGDVHAHHGEILQGVFYTGDGKTEHALVTLPCDLFHAQARFRPFRHGPLTVTPGDRYKARVATRLTLDTLGRPEWGGALTLHGNVPLSWGCGSSTADVVAAILAVADAFQISMEPEWLARLAVAAETASDSLMYSRDRCVLFAQRSGTRLLELGGPLPPAHVLGFNTDDEGKGIDTLGLAPIRYGWWEIEAFRVLRGLLQHAVERGDAQLLGRVATASAEINQRHRPNRLIPSLLALSRSIGALGLQIAHSGTVAGLLFETGNDSADRLEEARAGLGRLGVHRCWEFRTDMATQAGYGA